MKKTDQIPVEHNGGLIKRNKEGFYFQNEYGSYVIELLKDWDLIKNDITEQFYKLNPHIKPLE